VPRGELKKKVRCAVGAVKVVEVVAVWLKGKRGAVVKHWTRSDETKTLCGKKLDVSLNHPGVSQECVVCVINKGKFEAQRAREMEALERWQKLIG
jgi:hypothetical protein